MRSARPLLACLLLAALTVARAQVPVWQGTPTLPYKEGLPDPNPPFDQLATNRFNYPYTLRNNLTDRRVEHHWRAIYLENEYLKCSVLPDGGHLNTCVDKINGKPIFYANPSIKKAEIGNRGAWATFGVEFNFPVSHNWVSMSPLDFAFCQARRRQRVGDSGKRIRQAYGARDGRTGRHISSLLCAGGRLLCENLQIVCTRMFTSTGAPNPS